MKNNLVFVGQKRIIDDVLHECIEHNIDRGIWKAFLPDMEIQPTANYSDESISDCPIVSSKERIERKLETKIVKQTLAAAGINAKVGHGRGTAWGWLHINIGSGSSFGEHVVDGAGTHRDCLRCKKNRRISDAALDIAQQVTGRHGEYSGNILVLSQDDWSDKLKKSVAIEQDETKIKSLIQNLN